MRCEWANNDLMIKYHDQVWGKETHDEIKLFKMLVLEGMQAGLSWLTILKKEQTYSDAFDQFDYHKIASYNTEKIVSLYDYPGIIHNKNKIHSIITNAQCFIKIQKEYGSFDAFIWQFTHHPLRHAVKCFKDLPAKDELSEKIAKILKSYGFKYVGPVIIYSYLQAIGVYNDHIIGCEYE